MAKTILIVDDEVRIRKVIARYLAGERKYTLLEAADGLEALRVMRSQPVDLVILDLMMPHLDGEGFIRAVREVSDVYVIVLTARTGEDDQVTLYALGADDYVEKPFSCKALVSKVAAVFARLDRKLYGMAVRQVEGITLDEASRSVRVDGLERALKPKEYDLLRYLMLNQGVVLSRDQILGQVWGFDYSGGDRTVDVHVSNLRRKLGAHGERIQTVAGVGYRFEAGS